LMTFIESPVVELFADTVSFPAIEVKIGQ
jgi:hypothetical protein